VATVNTYQAVLRELADGRMDAAFLGSLVAVLAVDRHGAEVLAKPVSPEGVSTYTGVVFVPAGSPIKRIEDLAGHSIAMVRTTTAGDLYPVYAMLKAGLLDGPAPPESVWVGTHDDVVREALAGRVDAGAMKNLRLNAYLEAHPETAVRRLAESRPVPHDALVVRRGLAEADELRQVLLAMHDDPGAADALAAFGAERFVPCTPAEFAPIYDMVADLGERWSRLRIDGPPPRRPPALLEGAPRAGRRP
jgi:phosphonate transport system substrate-binding protein